MRVERFSFKEFDATVAVKSAPVTAGIKPLLPGGRRKEGAPPLPPTFSEEQLKAAERESYKKGFTEGTQEGRNQAESEQAAVDRQLSETVEKFVQTLPPLLADYRQMILQLRQDLPKVALAIARKAAGNALAENAAATVEDVAMRCVESMIAEPKLTVTVHESLADTLEKKLKAMAEKQQAATDIVVMRDAAIAPTDCRIEWKHGAMERHTGQLWQHIEKAVEAMSASAAHTTEVQMTQLQAQLPETQDDTIKKEERRDD
jgi:flagellar assembly protein FliH